MVRSQAGKRAKKTVSRDIRDNIELYLILLPVLVLIFIFSYMPMYGVVIAFQNYQPGMPFIGPNVKWVGLAHFEQFISSFYFGRILRNTLTLSGLNLLMGFWIPIIFALLLNEINHSKIKKFIQTVSYMPHFISMVVVAGMVISFISADGIIPKLAEAVGLQAKGLNTNPPAFKWIYTVTNIWKSFGWGSILYLSTMSAIDPNLYEAADIDGATRAKRIWYITIPHLIPLVIIQLIFAVGGLMNANTEMILLLYNPAIYSSADVIGTYMYRDGLLGGKFSFGSAVGLLMNILSFILVIGANMLARRLTDYSLW